MAKDLIHILQAVGMDDREAQLYLAGLQLGTAPASDYAKKAGINRITAYNTLESMVRRSFLTTVKKVRAKWYAPVAPEYLSLEVRKNAEALNRALPELKSLQGAKYRKPRVRFFEGWDGVRHVYEDTLTSSEPIRAYATVDDMHKALPNYFPRYYKRRAEKNISIRAIVPETPVGRERKTHDVEEKREIAFVPADKYYFSPEINIYDNKVMIASWREKLGIIIESEEIADAMKKIYELAWERAKAINKPVS